MNGDELKDKFIQIHGEDKEQLDFILSEKDKIIVTAPAGCGKTKAMISKIAHEIITNKYLNRKKILALTFSVNAATKIREDTNETLPFLLSNGNYDVDQILNVSNYHGFANKILRKHGYILHENLKNINDFLRVSDDNGALRTALVEEELTLLNEYDTSLKSLQLQKINELQSKYIDIVLKKLVPRNIITYNGLLLIAVKILETKSVGDFYKQYYQMVIVDEFQDTNYLALQFLDSLINANKVILMGDDIQKIYGFLGAVPDLFKHVESKYDMYPMEFVTNYRFKDNKDMKELDSYIRGIYKNYNNMSTYSKSASIKYKFFKSEHSENKFVYQDFIKRVNSGNNIAVLFRAKYLAENLIEVLEQNKQPYFNGLFDDSDPAYIKFHKQASEIFINESGSRKSVSKTVTNNLVKKMHLKKSSITKNEILFNSMVRLLETLLESTKAKKISTEEKYERILFTLNNNSLKRLINEINEKVILTTIHGSKGLEWDYVYLPKMTAYSFPGGHALCKTCTHHGGKDVYDKRCEFRFAPQLEEPFYEELSVLYVGVTRGKKDVILTANSEKNNYGYHKKLSCFLTLPNLKKVNEF